MGILRIDVGMMIRKKVEGHLERGTMMTLVRIEMFDSTGSGDSLRLDDGDKVTVQSRKNTINYITLIFL